MLNNLVPCSMPPCRIARQSNVLFLAIGLQISRFFVDEIGKMCYLKSGLIVDMR